MFLTSITMHPPYLVFLTVWPVIAVMAQIESGSSQRRLFRVIAAVLLVAWLPSMGWNMMRTREAYKFYSALSTAHLADELAATIPPEAPLMVSGDLYIAARSPTRKPFIVRQASPPSEWPCDAWLALTTSAEVPWNVSQLPGRVVHVSNENLFPGFPYSPKLTILTLSRLLLIRSGEPLSHGKGLCAAMIGAASRRASGIDRLDWKYN